MMLGEAGEAFFVRQQKVVAKFYQGYTNVPHDVELNPKKRTKVEISICKQLF